MSRPGGDRACPCKCGLTVKVHAELWAHAYRRYSCPCELCADRRREWFQRQALEFLRQALGVPHT